MHRHKIPRRLALISFDEIKCMFTHYNQAFCVKYYGFPPIVRTEKRHTFNKHNNL